MAYVLEHGCGNASHLAVALDDQYRQGTFVTFG